MSNISNLLDSAGNACRLGVARQQCAAPRAQLLAGTFLLKHAVFLSTVPGSRKNPAGRGGGELRMGHGRRGVYQPAASGSAAVRGST